MKRTLTKTRLAALLGVQTRTVNRWLEQGCPCSREKGRPLFNAEEVQRWRQQGSLAAEDPEPAAASDAGLPAGSQAALAALDTPEA